VEVGLHHRDESSSVQRVMQTQGNIGYKHIALERVHITSHKSWGAGEGMRGLEGG